MTNEQHPTLPDEISLSSEPEPPQGSANASRSEEDLARYRVESKLDIVRVLREIARDTTMVSAFFNEGRNQTITTIIKVIPEKDLLVLEKSQGEHDKQLMLASPKIDFEGRPNQVLVRFRVDGLTAAKFNGDSVFVTRLPDYIYRVQRREFFRISTSVIDPLTCHIPLIKQRDSLELADISVGGLSLNDPDFIFPDQIIELFNKINNCVLHIPEHGDIRVNLELRNIFTRTIKGKEIQRIGFAYVNLNAGQMTIIQRYINRLQIANKAKEKGYD